MFAVAAVPARAGLTITPTFDASLTAPEIAVINTAIAFYQNTFTDPITVTIEFHDMGTGLGQSSTLIATRLYQSFIDALRADASATSADDTLALAGGRLPSTANNPVNNSSTITVKTANLRAVGIPVFPGPGQFDGSIGLNTALTSTDSPPGPFSLLAVTEHEIDEVLGLGSGVPNGNPWPEDLFRYSSTANVYSTFSTHTCTAPPQAFFSIDGTAHINEFNNCDNGGDYGDWITHTPSQVQDAFTNGTGSPSLIITSAETRALDVIGYNIIATKKKGGQTVSD